MIGARRRSHAIAFSVLAILLPLCFVAGLWGRPVYPPLSSSASELLAQAGFSIGERSAEDRWESTERVDVGDYQFELAKRVTGAGAVQVAIAPLEVILQPDVLVYWDKSGTSPEDVGDRTVLLGALSGTARKQFTLPLGEQPPGFLTIYSRGQSTVLASIPVGLELSRVEPPSVR